jgi:AcrR family transcriptional regulator
MGADDSGQAVVTASRRQAILDAALACFTSKGFTETTMEDIRTRSGASTGSIYHHFANKEMLARALYLEGRTSLNTTLSSCLSDTSLREGAEALIYAYLQWFEEHADLGQYLLQASNSEYLSAYVTVLRQRTRTSLPAEHLREQVLHWLAPFIANGSALRLPESLYLPLILGPSREFVRIWLRTRQLEEIRQAREPLAQAAWQSITRSAGSR